MRTALRAAIVVLAAAVAGCQVEPPPDPAKVDLSVGNTAAVEKFLAANKGKVILVDCWATWCGPCARKFPALVKLHETFGPQGLVVLGVTFDEKGEVQTAHDFLAKKRAAFPNILVGPPSSADARYFADRFGYANGIPHVAVLDKTGKRVWDSRTDSGGEYEMQQRISTELAKAAPP